MDHIQKRKRREEKDDPKLDDFHSDNPELLSEQGSERARLDIDNGAKVATGRELFPNMPSSAAMEPVDNGNNIQNLKASNDLLVTTLSKRAIQRAAAGPNIGSNDKPKGLTRIALDGSMEHFLEKEFK
ncbi:hypothetical protein MMC34_001474 [Xylographa carneopallida]|nr:hypothetical protein [Xylographa carneopallida]